MPRCAAPPICRSPAQRYGEPSGRTVAGACRSPAAPWEHATGRCARGRFRSAAPRSAPTTDRCTIGIRRAPANRSTACPRTWPSRSSGSPGSNSTSSGRRPAPVAPPQPIPTHRPSIAWPPCWTALTGRAGDRRGREPGHAARHRRRAWCSRRRRRPRRQCNDHRDDRGMIETRHGEGGRPVREDRPGLD